MITIIDIPIYHCKLTIIRTDDLQRVVDEYGFKGDPSEAGAFTDVIGRELFAVFSFDYDNALIVHECTHLTNFLYKIIGAQLSIENDEHQAYITAWFYEIIDQTLTDFKAFEKA